MFLLLPPSSAVSAMELYPRAQSLSLYLETAGTTGIQFCHWDFTITDSVNNQPIANVRISILWDATVEFQIYTDNSGHATVNTTVYQTTYVNLDNPNYQSKHLGPFDSRTTSRTFQWTMTLGSPPSNTNTLTIYAQPDSHNWQTTGKVVLNGQTYYLTFTQPAKVVIWGLTPNTQVSIRVSGTYTNPQSNSFPTFDYTRTVTCGSAGQTTNYWIDVMTGEVTTGTPPNPPPDPYALLWQIINWVTQNFIIVIVVGVGLYLLPIFAPFLQPLFSFFGQALRRMLGLAKKVVSSGQKSGG